MGMAIGAGIDAIVEGVVKIGRDLQLDLLAEAAHDGAEAAGDFVVDGWTEWHDVQPITSTAVTAAAAATTVLAAVAGKRGLMMALSGSAIAGHTAFPHHSRGVDAGQRSTPRPPRVERVARPPAETYLNAHTQPLGRNAACSAYGHSF